MYQEHSAFESPDENEKIWRYMSFEKFVSMLDNNILHFARLDKLEDKFEGSWARPNIQLRDESFNELPPKVRDIFKRSSPIANKALRKFIFVNCWHKNDYESAAMWEKYSKNINGIAIQSTFGRLKESFKEDTENCVYIGNIQYIDYEKEPIIGHNFFMPYLYKWKSFKHEHELRTMTLKMSILSNGKIEIYDLIKKPSNGIGQIDYESDIFMNGLDIPIDLKTLIEKIYVAPKSPQWFNNLVLSIVNKYELEKEVKPSYYSKDPLY